MKVIIDDNVYETDYTTIAVCNAKYYGGGYKIGTNASLTDGLVDVYLADKLPKLKMAKLLLCMKKGKHENSKYIRVIKTNKLAIESDKEIVSNIDGDKLSSKTFDIEVIHNGIEVYYDQNLIDKVLKNKNY